MPRDSPWGPAALTQRPTGNMKGTALMNDLSAKERFTLRLMAATAFFMILLLVGVLARLGGEKSQVSAVGAVLVSAPFVAGAMLLGYILWRADLPRLGSDMLRYIDAWMARFGSFQEEEGGEASPPPSADGTYWVELRKGGLVRMTPAQMKETLEQLAPTAARAERLEADLTAANQQAGQDRETMGGLQRRIDALEQEVVDVAAAQAARDDAIRERLATEEARDRLQARVGEIFAAATDAYQHLFPEAAPPETLQALAQALALAAEAERGRARNVERQLELTRIALQEEQHLRAEAPPAAAEAPEWATVWPVVATVIEQLLASGKRITVNALADGFRASGAAVVGRDAIAAGGPFTRIALAYRNSPLPGEGTPPAAALVGEEAREGAGEQGVGERAAVNEPVNGSVNEPVNETTNRGVNGKQPRIPFE